MKIGNIEINSKLALAPLAGVSDIAFRKVCKEHGAGLLFTEMVSAKALVYQDKKTRTLLQIGEWEHPVAAQIFGSDPSCMAEGAALALEISGADFVDINMCCPVGKVVKNGDGCALARDLDKAMRVIEAVKKNVDSPVTVKIRKGWDKGDINAVEFAVMAEQAGADAITVHGMTRAQLYSGKSDWNIIRDVKKAVKIPVIANGDIFEANDVLRILRWTDADMAMIARGAFGNPWIFSEAKALLSGLPLPPRPRLKEIAKTAMGQFEFAAKHKGERIACLEARKHYPWYLRGIPNSVYYKERISKAESLDDLWKITDELVTRVH